MGCGVWGELHGLGFASDVGALAFVLWVALLAREGRRRQTVRRPRWRRCTLASRCHCWVSVPLRVPQCFVLRPKISVGMSWAGCRAGGISSRPCSVQWEMKANIQGLVCAGWGENIGSLHPTVVGVLCDINVELCLEFYFSSIIKIFNWALLFLFHTSSGYKWSFILG